MYFNLLQSSRGRKPRGLDHRPLLRRHAVQIGGDKEHSNTEGQRLLHPSPGLSRLTDSWKVYFLECLQSVILRNGMRHLEAARWHKDLVLKREKQADHIGMSAAAVLARAKDGNDET
ncbi:MAG: hypothetical protein CR217_08565 [Beijerinckiaceae bacterium]|nr:MAG: hypothetical protein CR217_08565 [Beijerinckiaceae bacterium]